MSKLYNEAKKKFIEPIVKKIFKPQKTTGTEVISKINPNVPDNILDKARRDLKLAKRRTIGSEAKLKTTQFEIGQGQKDLTFDYMKKDRIKKSDLKKKKDDDAIAKKAKGGRIGYKLGSPKKSKLKKIQEAFKPTQSFMVKKDKPKKRLMAKKGSPDPKKKKKFPDLTGDGKVTFADILKGRGVINGKKKKTKKKII
jgi:hypothetical protein